MGMYLVFILGANASPVPVLCGISAALLQDFMLVFFSWTAVESFQLYRKLVKILGVGQIPLLKIGLAVWCKLTITINEMRNERTTLVGVQDRFHSVVYVYTIRELVDYVGMAWTHNKIH